MGRVYEYVSHAKNEVTYMIEWVVYNVAFMVINLVRINLAHYLIVLSCPCCLYGIEVWGSAYEDKYLSRIDRFCKRASKFGYTTKYTLISDVTANSKNWTI